MFSHKRLAAKWPKLWDEAWDRLTDDHALYDREHRLQDGLTKKEARAILMLSCRIARKCGLELILNSDERELMGRKFKYRTLSSSQTTRK